MEAADTSRLEQTPRSLTGCFARRSSPRCSGGATLPRSGSIRACAASSLRQRRPLDIDAVLRAAGRVECPERELCEVGPVVLASLGDVTPTPWNTEREFSEEQLAERIAAMMDAVPQGQPTIVNFHCPPFGSGLDVAPELDATLKPVIRAVVRARTGRQPRGSRAIKRYRPVVGLHGHIHESRASEDRSHAVYHPGSDYTADLLRGVVVDIAGDGSYLDSCSPRANHDRRTRHRSQRRPLADPMPSHADW